MWKVEMGMREINFRAWNEVEGFLDTAWSIDFEHRLVCHRAHNQSDLDDCVLMQYTGLQDKNGREIYEGDIVKGYIGANNQEYTGVCEYSLKIAGFKFGNKKTNSYSKSTVTTARLKNKEVIGNIYENPELLEVKGNE